MTLVIVVLTLVIGGAVQAMLNLPDLQPWHRLVPRAELRGRRLTEAFTLEQYLKREAEVFDEVRDQVETPVTASTSPGVTNRYQSASISSPRQVGQDWNRTYELTPATVRGGALLIHGLTDGPYSMRAIGGALHAQGYYLSPCGCRGTAACRAG